MVAAGRREMLNLALVWGRKLGVHYPDLRVAIVMEEQNRLPRELWRLEMTPGRLE